MPDRVIDDRFQLVRELGRGGMGAVHVVFDREICREVALKRMLQKGIGHGECEERFRREYRALASITHPGVPQVHHTGRASDGSPWFTMEVVRGESLRALLGRDRLSPSRAIAIAIDLGQVLAAAHEAGIIHRDVKPNNVMIEPGDRVRLLDFGVCTPLPRFLMHAEHRRRTALLDRWETRDGDFAGTFGYSDPATFDGTPATLRSDIFSLAAILYEMLSGHRLFDVDASAYRTIDSAEFPASLASLANELRRAAAHNPFERPRSMPAFIQSLEIARGHMLRLESEARAARYRALQLLLGAVLGALLMVVLGLLLITAAPPTSAPLPATPATEPTRATHATEATEPEAASATPSSAPSESAPLEIAKSAPGDLSPIQPQTPPSAPIPRSAIHADEGPLVAPASPLRIRRRFTNRTAQVRRCATIFGAPGEVLDLRLRLGPTGHIRDLQLVGGGWFLLRRCIAEAFADLSFPPGTTSPQPLRIRLGAQ